MDPQQPNMNQQDTTPSNNSGQFTPGEQPKNNKTGLIIAVVVAVLVILGIVFFVKQSSDNKDRSPSNSSNSKSNDATSDTFQKYDVTDKSTGTTFSVSFYKGAAVAEKNGHTFLNVGEEGSMSSVYLGVATEDKIDCGNSPSATMRLNGESTAVCYMSDYTQYAGYANTKSGMVKINLAGQKPISMEDAKAILESITF